MHEFLEDVCNTNSVKNLKNALNPCKNPVHGFMVELSQIKNNCPEEGMD